MFYLPKSRREIEFHSADRLPHVPLFSLSGAPEEPFLVQNGKRIFPGDSVVAKENQTVTVECVARRAVPEVKQVFWSLGPDSVNVTGNSDLKVDFISHEDSYTTKSVLTLNTSRAMNHNKISCHVFHVAWPNATVVNASLNVLCKFYLEFTSLVHVILRGRVARRASRRDDCSEAIRHLEMYNHRGQFKPSDALYSEDGKESEDGSSLEQELLIGVRDSRLLVCSRIAK